MDLPVSLAASFVRCLLKHWYMISKESEIFPCQFGGTVLHCICLNQTCNCLPCLFCLAGMTMANLFVPIVKRLRYWQDIPPATHNNRHQVTFGLFAHTFSGGLGTKHPYNYTISHVTHWLYLLLAQFASLLSFLITIMLWKRSRNQHEISHSVGFH